MKRIDLNKNWTISENPLNWGINDLYKVKKNTELMETDIPCDIHKPLMEYGKIENPVVGDNYSKSLWIEDRSWWFCKKINITPERLKSKKIRVIFERLDYMADIFINDIHIGNHKSVFYSFEKDVKEYLKEGENTIYVRLTVGLEKFSREDVQNFTSSYFFDDKRYEIRRILTRKPQYVFGWDWCPRIPTCGITGNVYLDLIDEVKINNLHISTEEIDENKAFLKIDAEYEDTDSSATINGKANLKVYYEGKEVINQEKTLFIKSGINHSVFYVNIDNPQLWWPNGMGNQPMYTAEIEIEYNGKCETYQQRFGIRRVEICTDKLNDIENEFVFMINGKRFFSKGSNWIPTDSVYCNVTDEKYKKLLSMAKDMNCNMLRIWGGGLYEQDIFYDLCDELGILIWHDFMFCCGMVPDRDEKYISLVKDELTYQIKRLRNHPSIALWCGSNENHQFYEIRKVRDKLEYFGGELIYNYYAPELVWNYSPEIPYWNCSPYGGAHSKSNDAGDEHCWDNIFSANPDIAFSSFIYDDYTTKFTSEYGMLGPCCVKSIKEYMGTDEVDFKSNIFIDHTNTCDNFKKKEIGYIEYAIDRFYDTKTPTLEEYALFGGMIQNHILAHSIDSHRIRKNCGGTLTWMYTDCWGEDGWSVVDYYCRKKAGFYGIKRAYSLQIMAIRKFDNKMYLFLVNDGEKAEHKKIAYGYTSFDGKTTDERVISVDMQKGITKLELAISDNDYDLGNGVIYAKDMDNVMDKALCYTESYKFSDIPKSELEITDRWSEDDYLYIKVKAKGYIHGVHIEDTEEKSVTDMYFDLLPNEEKIIGIKDFNNNNLNINWINK